MVLLEGKGSAQRDEETSRWGLPRSEPLVTPANAA